MEKKIKKNTLLAPYTSFKIGGPAEFFFEPQTKDELIGALAWADEEGLAITVFGGGSNVLINDTGVAGLVLLIGNRDIIVQGDRIKAGAGAPLAKILSQCVNSGLSGLEWSHGIPRATIGGSLCGNAGAFGSNISDVVETVETYDMEKRRFETLSRKMCKFVYRSSLFRQSENLIIWEAVLKMISKDKSEVLAAMESALAFRMDKYPKLPSAGSVFKNIDASDIQRSNPCLFENEIKHRIGSNKQVGAGLIIDLLDLKGKTIGGAKISLEHANHIVNIGHATADDVLQLISFTKTRARNRFGISLKEELRYLGF